MNRTYVATIVVTAVVAVCLAESRHFFMHMSANGAGTHAGAIHSPYAGQEERGIKALPQADVEGLLAGAGTPFGGMAKPAELNGYPGPRHVLDAVEAGEFEITGKQKIRIEGLYEEMKAQAIALGEEIVSIEQGIEDAFANGTVTSGRLRENVANSADTYGRLRFVHLKYHLRMVDVLTPEQVGRYNVLRGYAGNGNPCGNVPEGHDPELWKMHNGCS